MLFPAGQLHLAAMAIPAAQRLGICVIAARAGPTYLFGLGIRAYEVAAGHRWIAACPEPRRIAAQLRGLHPIGGRLLAAVPRLAADAGPSPGPAVAMDPRDPIEPRTA